MDYQPRPEEPSPREIVKRLHDKIARLVPDGPDLVAKFGRLQEEKRQAEAAKVQPAPSEGRQERIGEFGDLLAEGLSPAEAAAVLGIGLGTAKKYRLALRRQGWQPGELPGRGDAA